MRDATNDRARPERRVGDAPVGFHVRVPFDDSRREL